jgi:transposase
VRKTRVWQRLVGVEKATVERVEFADEDADESELRVVVHVRVHKGERHRCGRCERRCPRYDGGEGRRWWRALDLGTVRVVIEADAPRVSCPEHGIVVAAVPWARNDSNGDRRTSTRSTSRATRATWCSLVRMDHRSTRPDLHHVRPAGPGSGPVVPQAARA